jgi:hypothetical protein
MGLDVNSIQFLIEARLKGLQLGEVLTIGRQDLNVFPAKMVQLLETHGFPADAFRGEDPVLYAEPCFVSMGARKVDSMDVSSFEQATVLHDLNRPIGAELRQRYDVVYDGGTLEHIFNVPTALKNCMEMVRVGGSFFCHTGTNNLCGHGFYQFSPELFFRAFSRENGYEVQRMVAHAVGPYGTWYEVADPEEIRSRVELLTLFPVMLMLHAKRVADKPIFEQAPQQSDYTPRWEQSAGPNKYAPSRPPLSRTLPGLARLMNVLKNGLGVYWRHSLWNRKWFRPVKRP